MNKTTLSKTSVNRNKISSSKKQINYLLVPLLLVLLVIPLIVHEYNYSNEYQQFAWFPNREKVTDFFLFYKSIFLTVDGIIIALILLYQRFTDKKMNGYKTWMIPLGLYAILVTASAIMSDYKQIVWNGGYEQFESTLVLLTYCLLVIYAYRNVKSERDIRLLIRFTAVGIALITLLGSFQAIGLDLFRTDLGKALILGPSNWKNINNIDFQFEKNRVYSSLYNPNYIGVYASLFFPIVVGFSVFTNEKWKKITAATLALLLVICTFGAQSKTGLIVLIITSIILMIVLRKKVFKNMKVFILTVLTVLVVFIIINISQNFSYLSTLKNALIGSEEAKPLQAVEVTNDYIKIDYNNKPIYVKCEITDDNSLNCTIYDENGEPHNNNYDSTITSYTLLDPEFNGITVSPVYLDENGTLGCEIVIDNQTWYFLSKTESNSYEYYNAYGRIDNIAKPIDTFLKGHESLFSGRGYIWSRSIPMLKNSWFIGTGADTYGYLFPQNDYVGKANYGFANSIITKPHNMYLQIGIQTGMLSLMSFLVFYILYVIDCIKTYHRCNYETYTEQIGILLLIGTIGYMISGIINDSTVTVSPMFWSIIGIGFACNRITKDSRERIKKLRSESNQE